ncbi:MAG TPA: hypothetical protein VMT38_09945 [Terracidiphilus sp.]|nr:hypothetical protein [Terracidiphilus sp.]
MTRKLLLLLSTLAVAAGGLAALNANAAALGAQVQPFQPQQAPSSPALVGTWSATVNWNMPSGIMITTSFTANGQVQSTTQNRMGMSFMLTGVYQYNAAQGTLSYTWRDYSPKQICAGGNCTPAPVPAPLGVANTSRIRFLNANQFVATSNGDSTTYIRTNGAGMPTR